MRTCRRTIVVIRRFSRNPGFKKALRVVRRDVVKTTFVSLVPSAIDDSIIHHIPMVQEAAHMVSMSTLTIVATILMNLAKL